METFFSDGFHNVIFTMGRRFSFTCKETGFKTNRERGVEGEFVERLWRSGDLVELYPLVGDLVDV